MPALKKNILLPCAIYVAFLSGCVESGARSSGSENEEITVTTVNGEPRVSLVGDSDSVGYNGSVELSWTTDKVKNCVASGGWSGKKKTSGSETVDALTADSSFVLTCTRTRNNKNNQDQRRISDSFDIAVILPPPPVLSLSADPASLPFNGSTTIEWSASGATQCTASGDWSGEQQTSGAQSFDSLVSDKIYTLSCTGPGGSVSESVQVSVSQPPAPAPTLTLSANPGSVSHNGSTTIEWSTTDATDCTASGDWSGSQGNSGSRVFDSLTSDQDYALSCSGPGGSVSESVTVTVLPPAPTLTLSANPGSVSQNGSTTIEWSTTDATDCVASGDWSGARNPSGSQTINGLNASTSYSLECIGPGGSVDATVNVAYLPGNTAPVADAGADQTVSTGSQVTLNGGSSSDVDGDPLSYAWALVTRPSGSSASLSDTSAVSPTFEADVDGVYLATLVVNDGSVNSVADSVQITATTEAGSEDYPRTLVPANYDCAELTVHCVDDDAGAEQEFPTIQQAVDVASPGDVVLVHDGDYAGFRVDNAGTPGNEILVTANGNDANVISPGGRSGNDNIYVANSDYVIIEGFDVTGALAFGIATHDASAVSPMQGVQFRYNTVSGSGSTNIYLSNSANSVILGNTTFGSLNSHGIYISNAGADDNDVVGNLTYDNAFAGIHFNGDASVGGDGVITGLRVDSNTVYGNGSNGFNLDGVRDSLFVNNLIYDNVGHGIRAFRIDASDGPANLTFVNNTIVGNNQTAIKTTADDGGHLFFNNILLDNGAGCIYVENTSIVSDNNIFNNNCQFTPNNSSLFFGAESLVATQSQLFADATADDYRLKAGSPAIDAGTSSLNGSDAPDTDIGTDPRDANVDVGAFEF